MNINSTANTPNPAAMDASVANAAPQPQRRPQVALAPPPELPNRKPSEIAMDTTGVSSASVRESARPIEKVVQEAANAIQEFIQSKGSSLSISVDHTTGYHIIRVTDSNGNQVMTMPSEAAVRIAHNMQAIQGLFVDQTAQIVVPFYLAMTNLKLQ